MTAMTFTRQQVQQTHCSSLSRDQIWTKVRPDYTGEFARASGIGTLGNRVFPCHLCNVTFCSMAGEFSCVLGLKTQRKAPVFVSFCGWCHTGHHFLVWFVSSVLVFGILQDHWPNTKTSHPLCFCIGRSNISYMFTYDHVCAYIYEHPTKLSEY